jgi:ribosomal protein L37E
MAWRCRRCGAPTVDGLRPAHAGDDSGDETEAFPSYCSNDSCEFSSSGHTRYGWAQHVAEAESL